MPGELGRHPHIGGLARDVYAALCGLQFSHRYRTRGPEANAAIRHERTSSDPAPPSDTERFC
jgi:hypothetical protein